MAQEYIKPTKVWAYLKEKEIRISGDAKPEVIKLLNNKIVSLLDDLISKLPRYSKGENKGGLKRKTIKVEDLT